MDNKRGFDNSFICVNNKFFFRFIEGEIVDVDVVGDVDGVVGDFNVVGLSIFVRFVFVERITPFWMFFFIIILVNLCGLT